jgi:hypothetical protein
LGLVLAAGFFQGSFMAPSKWIRGWEWENYWLIFAVTAYLVCPWLLAFATIPRLLEIYSGASASALASALVFGAGWGLGAVTFGLGVEALGLALGFAVILGIAATCGAVIPLFFSPVSGAQAAVIAVSLSLMLAGVGVCSYAGKWKEAASGVRSYRRGLAICIVSGLLSACGNLGFAFGGAITERAQQLGVSAATAPNVLWTLLTFPLFLCNAGFAFYLLRRNRTLSRYSTGSARNAALAVTMGVMWMAGIGLYGTAARRLGTLGPSLGWAMLMTSMVLFANMFGLLTGEWRQAPDESRSKLRNGVLLLVFAIAGLGYANTLTPTFHSDIRPILQKHCQSCHRPGEIGPMPLLSYEDVRPWAAAIRESVKLRRMPPWFADPRYGSFSNDPRLTNEEIGLIENWVAAGAARGKPSQTGTVSAAKLEKLTADLTLRMPAPIPIPAGAVIDYQYVILPLPFNEDRWVRAVEVRPSDRSVVHHAVLYIRETGSQWLREVKPGRPYAPDRNDSEAIARSRDTKADILAVYTPGAPVMTCPDGMAKKMPAGSDLVLQVHYTSKKIASKDQTEVALAFSAEPPQKRILTLQMGRDDIRIPPGERDYRASVSGTLPGDALLISMFPHMHLRGVAFDFDLVGANGYVETLLKVKPYRFDWQLNYVLKTPRFLAKGTRLRWTGYFDNSANNPFNPDPSAEVTWGEQSWDEMMIGFFDVAVDPDTDKNRFFVR